MRNTEVPVVETGDSTSYTSIPSSTSHFELLVGALLLFGALARLVGFLQNASLTGDEAMLALSIGRRSLQELLLPLDYGQVATVPFLWSERLVTLASGVSGYTLRIVPLLAGTGLLWVVYRLARRLSGPLDSVVALALAATSYPLIRYSVEVKPYILDSLVSVTLVWISVLLAEDLDNPRGWFSLAAAGSIGVLFSTPALLVSAAAVAGLAIPAVRTRRFYALPRLGLLLAFWGLIFSATYVSWYRANADAVYMHKFWGEAYLRLGMPHFLNRLWFATSETACTLTCWRGALDLTPGLLLFAVVGTREIVRRRGLEYALLVGGPVAAAFGASAVGGYPIVTRLMLFSAPLLCIMVAGGLASVASFVERRFPRIRARWVLLFFIYPSAVVAAALTFTQPVDWGVAGVDIRPLAEEFRRRGGEEPIYVFARSVPAWVFHSTQWGTPDTLRLAFAARIAGPGGPGFVNASSRGPRRLGEGQELLYSSECRVELYGTPTGSQARAALGHIPRTPDPGWAESEAWRIRQAARPFVWIVMSDFVHAGTDEREVLMKAVNEAGARVVYTKSTPDAVLYRVQFYSSQPEQVKCSRQRVNGDHR